MIVTYQYRIKDSTSKKHLKEMSRSVNYVWNYCNEISQRIFRREKKFLSGYDLNSLTSGTSQELCLHSQTIQRVCEEYALRRKVSKKIKLKWRSRRRSLGWIPFKKSAIKIKDNCVCYKGQSFKFWKTREIQGEIREGSFSQDSRGRWYVNIACEIPSENMENTVVIEDVGIDLGLKTQLTCSHGEKYSREKLTKKYQKRLGIAQRAKKKHQVTKIYQKIKNTRKDWNHKVTTTIVKTVKNIFVGDVSARKLAKTTMATSVYDSSWGQLRSFLKYKATKLGRGVYQDVNESFSTCRCSDCLQKTGPKGLRQLEVREWTCGNCGSVHDRDVNAARNILRIGHDTLTKGIPFL